MPHGFETDDYRRGVRIAAVAVSLLFVALGLLFALLGFASGWGGGTEWAQVTLFFGGFLLAAVGLFSAATATLEPPIGPLSMSLAILTVLLIAAICL